ncbi:MAG: lactate dehydrogenase [Pedobacter sp.]|nr:MAG: lactate dehydrogenase [Pedobacter sp.]
MKAIAYNISPQDKEWLIQANFKKHDITIITNSLSAKTLAYAAGKEALILLNEDPLSANQLQELKNIGIKYIATGSYLTDHIDLEKARQIGLKIANVPFEQGGSLEIMQQVIKNLDNWGAGNCVGEACCCQKTCGIKTQFPESHA